MPSIGVCRRAHVTVRSHAVPSHCRLIEVLLMRMRVPLAVPPGSPVALLVAAGLRSREPRRGADAVGAVLRQEQHPLRQVRLAHLHDRSLRDLLLPGARAASRAGRRLRRERLPADQRRPEARPVVQGAADPVQDAQRVRAAERRARRGAGRRRRVRRAVPRAHASCRSTIRRTGCTASSPTSSRTSSSSTSSRRG